MTKNQTTVDLWKIVNNQVNLRVNNYNLITGKLMERGNGVYIVDGVYFHKSDVTSILQVGEDIYLFVYIN